MVGPAPTLPGILGTSAPAINNADMKSYGWEMELSWRDRINEFNYGVRFTLADGQREVTKYAKVTRQRSWLSVRAAILS